MAPIQVSFLLHIDEFHLLGATSRQGRGTTMPNEQTAFHLRLLAPYKHDTCISTFYECVCAAETVDKPTCECTHSACTHSWRCSCTMWDCFHIWITRSSLGADNGSKFELLQFPLSLLYKTVRQILRLKYKMQRAVPSHPSKGWSQ